MVVYSVRTRVKVFFAFRMPLSHEFKDLILHRHEFVVPGRGQVMQPGVNITWQTISKCVNEICCYVDKMLEVWIVKGVPARCRVPNYSCCLLVEICNYQEYLSYNR